MGGDNLKEEPVQAAVSHLKPLPEPPRELEKLFHEHNALIFRTAYRVTGSAEDAEDVLQTVFLRLARRTEVDAELACYVEWLHIITLWMY